MSEPHIYNGIVYTKSCSGLVQWSEIALWLWRVWFRRFSQNTTQCYKRSMTHSEANLPVGLRRCNHWKNLATVALQVLPFLWDAKVCPKDLNYLRLQSVRAYVKKSEISAQMSETCWWSTTKLNNIVCIDYACYYEPYCKPLLLSLQRQVSL